MALGIKKGMTEYLLIIFYVGVGVVALTFLHTILVAVAKSLGVTDTITITYFFDLIFRITLFTTLIPIGAMVFLVSLAINPAGDIGFQFVNMFIGLFNTMLQGVGWAIPKLVWTTVDTSKWLTDFSTLVDQGIKMLLSATV